MINDCIKKSYLNLATVNLELTDQHMIQWIIKFLPKQTNFFIKSGGLSYWKAQALLAEFKESLVKKFEYSKRINEFDDMINVLEYLSNFESLSYAEIYYKPSYPAFEKERYSKFIEDGNSYSIILIKAVIHSYFYRKT